MKSQFYLDTQVLINKNKYLLFIITSIVFSSCVVYKPDSYKVTQPDYNKRVEVQGPFYEKRLTPVGYGSFVVATACGAAAGYNSNMFTSYNGDKLQKNGAIGAVTFGIVGFATSYYLNKLMGWGNVKSIDKPQKWIKKANRNYLHLEYKGDKLLAINKNAELDFSINNYTDFFHFFTAFPKSIHSDKIIQKSLLCTNISRSELLKIIDLYPKQSETNNVKIEYIKRSNSINELISAKSKFRETNYDIEWIAANLIYDLSDAKVYTINFPNGLNRFKVEEKSINFVNNVENALIYKTIFPNSKYFSLIFNRVLEVINRDNIPELIQLFSELNNEVENAKRIYLTKSKNLNECLGVINTYPDLKVEIEKHSILYLNNYNDVQLYRKYFVNNKYDSTIQMAVMDNCNLNELIQLIKFYPNSRANDKLKGILLTKTQNINDYILINENFSDLNDKICKKAIDQINNYKDFKIFIINFPSASNQIKNDIFSKLININDNIIDIPEIIKLFPKANEVLNAKNKYIENCNSIDEFALSVKAFPEMKNTIFKKIDIIINETSEIKNLYLIKIKFPILAKKIEDRAYNITSSINDCLQFSELFPNSIYKKKVQIKLNELKKEKFIEYCKLADDYILKNEFNSALDAIYSAEKYTNGSAKEADIIFNLKLKYDLEFKLYTITNKVNSAKKDLKGKRVYKCFKRDTSGLLQTLVNLFNKKVLKMTGMVLDQSDDGSRILIEILDDDGAQGAYYNDYALYKGKKIWDETENWSTSDQKCE